MANALLYTGRLAFGILSWTALAALCVRNPAGAVMVLACGEVANSVGAFMGFELGHLCNALLVAHPEAVAVATGAAVLALFAYVLGGLRGFSFAETIRGVEPAEPLPSPVPAAPSHDESLDVACDGLAAERGLTNREREVLGMLARGHNGYHIRDELTLSYNTVKTHVKRVYRKLDVHGQQELIDLVERTAAEKAEG